MKKLGFILVLVLLSSVAFGQNRRREQMRAGACFFLDDNYRGRSFCLGPGESLATLPEGFDRQITAIRVWGNAVVTAFRERNFGGSQWVVISDQADLRRGGGAWSDRIRSVRVDGRNERGSQARDWNRDQDRGRDRNRDGDWNRPWDHDRDRMRDWREVRAGACFFRDGDYQGERFCLRPGEEIGTLPAGFDRQITAIKLIGDAVITTYRERNFEGERWILEHDVRDARFVDGGRWNDRIRSIRVDAFDEDYMGGRRRWRGASGACFYQDGDFQGQRFCLRAGEQATNMPEGFDRTVTAMRVFGDAVVTVYRDRELRGDRKTYDNTVRDFRFIDNGFWNDRIRSARVDDRNTAGGY